MLRVFAYLTVMFSIAAMVDGLSGELARAARDGSCGGIPVDTSFQPVPPVIIPEIPEALPDIPGVPDLAPMPNVPPVPGGLTSDRIARGDYACRIGFSNFFLTITSDSGCSTKDMSFGEAHECTCSNDQATGAIRIDSPVEAELQRNSLRYTPEGMTGSKPDRNGPGIEASRFSLTETAPPTDW